MERKRIGIVGATGYVGMELLRLLCGHAGFRAAPPVSKSHAGRPFSEVHPAFRGLVDEPCADLDPDWLAAQCDFVVTALPHGVSASFVPQLLDRGLRVLDHSADFRFRDPAAYEAAYRLPHPRPDLCAEAVYGWPERYRDRIASARLVANPGCYPTASLLAVAPLLATGAVRTDGIVVNAVSGISGAGRKAETPYLYCESADDVRAYAMAGHRHTPEIEQEMSFLAGEAMRVTFVPHLVPMKRGMLATVYLEPRLPVTQADLRTLFLDFYRGEPLVRVLADGSTPSTRSVAGTGFCDVAPFLDTRTGRIIVLSAIDNLGKGAAAQALQALNLMAGFPETEGLRLAGLAV